MADNTQVGTGTGDVVRDKDRAGVKTQIVGIDLGIGTGTESLMSGAMPVNIATSAPTAAATVGSITAVQAQATGVASTTGQIVIDVSQYGNLTFHLVTAAFVGTLQFEATLDTAGTSTTWGPWLCIDESGVNPSSTSLAINTAAAFIRQYTAPTPGPKYLKIRCSAFTSGAVAVVAQPGPQILETSPSLGPSSAQIGIVGPQPTTTGTITSPALAVTSFTALAANTARKAATYYNDSGNTVYLALASTASTTAYTVQIPPSGYYEQPGMTSVYTGIVTAIALTASGNLRVTEIT